jgi:hypothetical protein
LTGLGPYHQVRFATALGYFVRPSFFVREGKIEGVEDLGRAGSHVEKDGTFRNASFRLNINWNFDRVVDARFAINF